MYIAFISLLIYLNFLTASCRDEASLQESKQLGDELALETELEINVETETLCQWQDNKVVRVIVSTNVQTLKWQSCYGFRPCVEKENGEYQSLETPYSDEFLKKYKQANC